MFEKLFKTEAPDTAAQVSAQHDETLQKEMAAQLQQISLTENQQQLSDLATTATFTKVRQAAAEKITHEAQLHLVEKSAQDKAVQHIVREKLKHIKQIETAQNQAIEELETLCKKTEQLASSSHTPLFKQQYQHLLNQWQEHTGEKTALQARHSAAKTRCDAVMVNINAEEARIAADIAATQQVELAVIEEDEAQKILRLQQAEERQALEAQKIEQSAQKQQALEAKKIEHAKEQAKIEQSLKDLLAALESTLTEGHIANATKKLKNAQLKLTSLDKKTAHHYEGKLQLLQNTLTELRDWQGFAAIPKKQELCEKMQQLVGVDLPPQALAEAIHQLQEEWRGLKGGDQKEEQKLWAQFKEVADKAYEPCKQHFEQQKNIRSENLRQRENICSALETYSQTYNWAGLEHNSPDWKAVEKIIETAKNEFHRFSPIDHKQLTAIKTRYDAALKPIIEKLRTEQKFHEEHKKQLIEQAKKLLEQTDIRAAIEGAKQLQQQWKTSGMTRQREDQKLWQQFRSACDAIFSRRNTEQEQAQESLKVDITKAEELCKAIETLAALNDGELQKSKDQYADLRRQFLDIRTLSKEKQQKIFRHFYKACDYYQERVAGIKDRKQQFVMQEALRKVALCEQLESGATITIEEAEAQWASDITLSTEFETALKKRLEQAAKISRGEVKTNIVDLEKKRRLILIQLEIINNQETPAEDKALRMEFQLKQLSGGLGKKVVDVKQHQSMLFLEWLSSAAGLPENRETLQQRFNVLIKT